MSCALYQLTRREIVRFLRQRSRLVGALLTPLLFWAMLGGGLGQSFRDLGENGARTYLEFFFPGALALSVLFTAIFSTISVIEDRHEGFLQGVLVSPVSRPVLLLSKIFGAAILGSLQGLLLLLLAPFAGLPIGVSAVCLILVVLFLMAASMTTLGFYFAWSLDSVQGYHGIMNTVLMPMWILSGAVFPLSGSSPFFQWIARINPLSYGIIALKEAFKAQPLFSNLFMIWPMLLFALVMFLISLRKCHRS